MLSQIFGPLTIPSNLDFSLHRLEEDMAVVSRIVSMVSQDPVGSLATTSLASIGCACLVVAVTVASSTVISNMAAAAQMRTSGHGREKEDDGDAHGAHHTQSSRVAEIGVRHHWRSCADPNSLHLPFCTPSTKEIGAKENGAKNN